MTYTQTPLATLRSKTGSLLQKLYSEFGLVKTELDALAAVDATRSATLVVAASDSSDLSKDQADYVCDGTADQTEINAAIAALPATGGRVLLLDGTYITSSDIVPTSNTSIVGQGFSTIIKPANSSTHNIFSGTNLSNILLKDFRIEGNKSNLTYQDDADLQNGILCNEWYNSVLNNLLILNCIGNGLRIKTQDGTDSSKLLHNQISNVISRLNNVNGCSIETYAEYMNFGNCSFSNNTQYGVYINSANNIFSNCTVIQNSKSGVFVDTSAKTTNNMFFGNQINHNLEHGVFLNTDTSNTIIQSCKVIANSYHGIYNYASGYNVILGNTVTTNSYGNPNQYDQICIAQGSLRCNVSNNSVLKYSGGARYGINEISSSDYNVYVGNVINTHTTGTMNITGANSSISKNIGYINENKGTATITTGQTTVDVTHGLAAAPTRVILSPTTATAGKDYYVSAKAASTFTITIDSAAEADISFDWQAIV